MELSNIKSLVTGSPMVAIKYEYQNKIKTIYAKLEWFSLTGSVKDRVAYQIFKDAYDAELLKKGDKIVEVSSGNMGISISAMGNLLGNPVTIIMPKNMSEERKKLLKLYGTTLVEVEDFKTAFKECDKYIRQGYFCTRQFENISNFKVHYEITATEIMERLKAKVEVFVAGVGTGGTLSGVGMKLKEGCGLKVVAVEPENSQILSGKSVGHHKLQGLSDEIVPKLYQADIVDQIIAVSDEDAIAMARKLSRQLSLAVGISAGANIVACVLSGRDAVTIIPDDNKKYLTTDLTKCITTKFVESVNFLKISVI